jgi:hypothetical protein
MFLLTSVMLHSLGHAAWFHITPSSRVGAYVHNKAHFATNKSENKRLFSIRWNLKLVTGTIVAVLSPTEDSGCISSAHDAGVDVPDGRLGEGDGDRCAYSADVVTVAEGCRPCAPRNSLADDDKEVLNVRAMFRRRSQFYHQSAARFLVNRGVLER